MAENQFVGIAPVAVLPAVWGKALEVMKRKPRGCLDRYLPDEVYEKLLSADWQLWVALEDKEVLTVGLTRHEVYANEAVFRVIYVGGEMSKFMPDAMEVIEAFAMHIGADRIACDTSAGIARIMRKFGYGVRTYEVSKNLKMRWRH